MTFKDVMLDDSSLHTGEVVGSIPTAPTSKTSDLVQFFCTPHNSSFGSWRKNAA